MKTKKIWAKLTAVFLAVQLICGMIPVTVYASNAESEQTLIVQESQEMPTFDEVVAIDNIQIAVKAPEGAFPEGAHLCVDRLAEGLQEQSDRAVEGIRPAGLNVVCSYTYDIYVSAEDGTRLVPENGQPAEVAFILPEASDADLRADVYTVVTDENSGELTASAAESLIDRAESAVRVSANRLEVFSLEFSDSDRTEEPTGAEEMPAFDQSVTADGAVISVKAPEGVFPAGAVLSAEKVPAEIQALADIAVEKVRAEGTNTGLSYTFDIKVLDAEGNELSPAEGQNVEVSFLLAQVNDENLDTAVYHITEADEGGNTGELEAEPLAAQISGTEETVTVETDGFSLYTVEFTYHDLRYVLKGGGKVALSEILSAVGLKGEAEAVTVSNQALFSAAKNEESGEWEVCSHKAFSTKEWMKVTIAGVEYEITVTDERESTAGAGTYLITVSPLNKDHADFISLTIEIADAEGNTMTDTYGDACSYDTYAMGWFEKWDPKQVSVDLDEAPGRLRITSTYKMDQPGYIYEELVYETPFPEWASNETATGVSSANAPGSPVDFCRYYVEYLDGPLHYMDENGNPQVQEDYTVYTGGLFGEADLSESGKERWYAVRGKMEVQTADIRCDAHVVMCDDSELTVTQGILIYPGCPLTIYGQQNYSGHLIAKGEMYDNEHWFVPLIEQTAGTAGIGYIGNGTGYLTINGAYVTAWGGVHAAGIGGGEDRDSQLIVTINGGEDGSRTKVVAKGGVMKNGEGGHSVGGAGIGGGNNGNGNKVVINGGNVTAIGGVSAAGIGGGEDGDGGEVIINGGIVNAKGNYRFGAGIGGGDGGTNGEITINGGTVTAEAANPGGSYDNQNCAAAIGAGAGRAQGGKITINGGDVTATSHGYGAGIGGGEGSNDGYAGGEIEINGKDTNVVAMSVYGAGIGSGGADIGENAGSGARGGDITINDGFVFGMSTAAGAGIGGGNDGNGGKITINDGYVIGYGGSTYYSWYDEGAPDTAGRGVKGYDKIYNKSYMEPYLYNRIADGILDMMFSGEYSGAGIGGGDDATGGTVTINGGVIIAKGGTNSCSAIGWGDGGAEQVNLYIYDNAEVSYGKYIDGKIQVDSYTQGDDKISKAKNYTYALIQPGQIVMTFDVAGIGTAPESQVIAMNDTAEKPEDPVYDPAETGGKYYIFDGWYKDSGYEELFDFDAPVMTSTTVYGRWVEAWPLTVRKVWPADGKVSEFIPGSTDISFMNLYDARGEGEEDDRKETGTLTITAEGADEGAEEDDWTAALLVTPDGSVTLEENATEGFRPLSWTLQYGDKVISPEMKEDGSVELNLAEVMRELGLNVSGFTAALTEGSLVLTLENTRAYTVIKEWKGVVPQNYRIEEENFTGSFDWLEVIDHIDVVLQHKEGSIWETVEECTLQEAKDGRMTDWKESFGTAIDDPDAYRIREVIRNDGSRVSGTMKGEFVLDENDPLVMTDENGNPYRILYDKDDPEFDGQEPSFVFRCYPQAYGVHYYVYVDGTFYVSYDFDQEGNFVITNRKGTFLSAAMRWEGETYNYPAQKPEGITVCLQHQETGAGWKTVEEKELNEENGWAVTFDTTCPEDESVGNYRIRELGEDGKIAYNTADPDREGNPVNTASFTGTDNSGQTHDLLYTVTYSADANGHTVITNHGRSFSVEKVWKLVDKSDTPYEVYARLERLRSRDGEEEVWTRVQDVQLRSISQWKANFRIVWEAGEYRVRELTGSGGDVIHAGEDADGDGSAPVFRTNREYLGHYVPLAYNVSYEEDNNGKTVITNEQRSALSVVKKWDIDTAPEIKPESIQVGLFRWFAKIDQAGWEMIEGPVTLSEENGWKAEFDLIALAPGGKLSDYYCVREIDQDGKVVIDNSAVRETDYAMFDGLYDSGANELEKNVDGRVSCTSGSGDAAQKKDYTVEYDLLDTTGVTTITNREEITEGTVIVKSANVAFEGQILLEFTLSFPESVLADEAAYVSFTKAGTVTKRPVSEGKKSGNDVVFTIPVPAPEYADDIVIKVYGGDDSRLTLRSGNGTDYTEDGFAYSVRTYAQKKSQNGSTQEMRDLAKALDDYGTAAQIYFRYGDFSGAAVDSAVTAVTLDDLAPYALTTEGTKPAGVTGAGIMVEFDTDNTLRVTFKTDGSKPIDSYTFLMDGTETAPTKKGKNAYLQVKNIAAPNLDTPHTFTVTDGTDTYTVTASALSYAYTSVKNGDSARQNLGKALYLYNQAADAYFDK